MAASREVLPLTKNKRSATYSPSPLPRPPVCKLHKGGHFQREEPADHPGPAKGRWAQAACTSSGTFAWLPPKEGHLRDGHVRSPRQWTRFKKQGAGQRTLHTELLRIAGGEAWTHVYCLPLKRRQGGSSNSGCPDGHQADRLGREGDPVGGPVLSL